MECILNHCHDSIAADVAVTIFYSLAVGIMIVFALLSQSRAIQTAALLLASVWLISLLYYLIIGGARHYALIFMLDGALAYQFWRMAQREMFPVFLFYLMLADMAFILFAFAISLEHFWFMFMLNRNFDATLLYIIGSSIYRIRKLSPPVSDGAKSENGRLKFIAG